jgi:hypothetical protein
MIEQILCIVIRLVARYSYPMFNRSEGFAPDDSVRELIPWEVTSGERFMVVDSERVRHDLFSSIHDSDLGFAIAGGVRERLSLSGGSVRSPITLSKLGNNTALDDMKRLPEEDAQSEKRNPANPFAIYEHGGMCVEGSMIAEAAEHLAYSQSADQPPFKGYTQEVLLRSLSEDGKVGHHMVLRSTIKDSGSGETSVRFADPMNGLEGPWEDLLSGRAYENKNGRPTEIFGVTKEIEFVWLPPSN